MLLQEENQRETSSIVTGSYDAIAMAIKPQGSIKPQFKGSSRRTVDNNVTCEFCHMPGHLKDKCYCIHGYPTWDKLFGKSKPKYLSVKNTVVADVSQTSPNVALQSSVGESVSSGLHMSSDTLPLSDGQGMTSHFVQQVHSVQSADPHQWIIDTGATDHVTPFLHLLYEPKESNAAVQLPNGEIAVITHSGCLKLPEAFTLRNVLCIPSFAYNLLSISNLIQGNDSQVNFMDGKCFIQGSRWSKKVELGCQVDGVYLLHFESLIATCLSSQFADVSLVAHVANSDIWHTRIGHVPASILKFLSVQCKNTASEGTKCIIKTPTGLSYFSIDDFDSEIFDEIPTTELTDVSSELPTYSMPSTVTPLLPSLPVLLPPVPLRPQRNRHVPVKLLDYTGLPSTLATDSFVSYVSNPKSSAAILEPQTYKQAV
ncbi:hypothetical protein AgCh_024845 [Apium graveolens]